MLKKLMCFWLILLITGCGIFSSSHSIDLFESGDEIPSNKAVLIAKLEFTPGVSFDGGILNKESDPDDFVEFHSVFAFGPEVKPLKKDQFFNPKEDGEFSYRETHSNQFFAIEVDPAYKTAHWIGYILGVEHPGFWKSIFKDRSGGRGYKTTRETGFKITSSKNLEPGQVYYLGTLNVKLVKKSYKEIGDDEYDFQEAEFLFGNKSLKNELYAAQSWFQKEYKTRVKVQPVMPRMIERINRKSEYRRDVLTTY